MTPVGAVHNARLAWDAARAVVAVADSDDDRLYHWLADLLDFMCGPEYERALTLTRTRLAYPLRPDVRLAEAGMWRARLEELLGYHPEQAPRLRALLDELHATGPLR